ncbi:MAG: LysM peptidoglycan-binding domain-containing protein [Pirellulaceae bacterium]|nr:LysM peptidoglycan-binding domain-containing protein [Pirellulaceae bacterium]
MNSIKNAIVTVTLLAVSYGAYVVLSNPPAEPVASLGGMDEADVMGVSVTIPEASAGAQLSADSATQVASPQTEPSLEVERVTNDWVDPFPASTASPAATDSDPYGYSPQTDAPGTASGNLPESDVATLNPPGPGSTVPDSQVAASQLPGMQAPQQPFGADAGTSADDSYDQQPAASYPETSDPVIPPVGEASADLSGKANGFDEAWKLAQSSINTGKLEDALMTLSIWYNEPSMSTEQARRCTAALDELAGTVIYSQESFMEPAYVVQEGETLGEIAAKYQVPVDFLARINGVATPYELYPGESLKVVKGPFRAELRSEQAEITVFLGRHYAGRFAARIGAGTPIAEGDYEVASKEAGREYFDRTTGYRVSREDPSNPYGSYWIGLRGEQVTAAHNVGIHVDMGSPNAGCIAVSQSDVADLNAILSIGSRLTVRR